MMSTTKQAHGAGADVLMACWTLGSAVSCLIGFIQLRRLVGYRPRPSLHPARGRPLLMLGIPNQLLTLTERAPGLVLPLLLAHLVSPEVAAYWYPAWMMAWAAYTAPMLIGIVQFSEGVREPGRLAATTWASFRWSLVIGSVAAVVLIPDIGVMGVAMGGNPPGIGEFRWVQPFMRLVEKRCETVAIRDAVNAEAKPGEGLPIQGHARQFERLANIEICQSATGIDASEGIDQALIEQSMNRLGGNFRGRDAVQRFQIHFQNRLIQPALGFHRLSAGCRIVLEVQCTQDVGKTRVAAAAIDKDLFTREH